MKKIIRGISCVIFVELIGSLSAFFAGDIRGKYEGLNKAPFSPAPEVFGIVWPILYLLIGLALFFMLENRKKTSGENSSFVYFTLQLVLNFLWSVIFFGNTSYWLALLVVVGLDVTTLLTIQSQWNKTRIASYFMVPYFVWILFATYLNVAFAILNP